MHYIIGDIGNTSTRICLLNKSKILKSIIFDTSKILGQGGFGVVRNCQLSVPIDGNTEAAVKWLLKNST